LGKSEEIVRQLQDEKQWLEQESKRQVEESERKLENVRAGELQELRRGKVEALQVLQVSLVCTTVLLSGRLCIACVCDAALFILRSCDKIYQFE